MKNLQATVANQVGLHARPAAEFVKTAAKHKSKIMVRNVTQPSDWVNAKSILKVLSIGVSENHQIEIEADGEDEEAAIAALEALIRSNFGE
jgi:phosphocarrier protein FPr